MIVTIDTSKITRIEVIDESGRAYTDYNVKHTTLSMQDNNKTLKLFIENKDKNEKM